LLAAADSGGVPLLPPHGNDGQGAVCEELRPGRRDGRRAAGASDRAGRAHLQGHRPEADDHAVPAPDTAARRPGLRDPDRGEHLMCGIAGIARREPSGVEPRTLLRMAAAIEHRGPDGYGYYAGSRVGLAHVRLSIIDLAMGAQPLANEDGSVLATFNGEVYNYIELRRELISLGHVFRTHCDTEVLVHGYEQWGVGMIERLNGQFAFAIYDRRNESLLLVRDRFGVRPLFYALRGGNLYFASEVKA